MIRLGAWLVLAVLVVVAWGVRAVVDLEAHFGVRGPVPESLGRRASVLQVLADKKLVWAWTLLLALVSIPASGTRGQSLSTGASVAVSGGLGLLAAFGASAVAYLRLPAEVRRGPRGGRAAIILWSVGLITAALLLVTAALVLDWWVALGS